MAVDRRHGYGFLGCMLHFREWKLRDRKSEDEEDEGDKRAREKGGRRERVAVEKRDEEIRNERSCEGRVV